MIIAYATLKKAAAVANHASYARPQPSSTLGRLKRDGCSLSQADRIDGMLGAATQYGGLTHPGSSQRASHSQARVSRCTAWYQRSVT
jgi:hypothetical protein